MKTIMLCPWCLQEVDRARPADGPLRLPIHSRRGGVHCAGSMKLMSDRVVELESKATAAMKLAARAKRRLRAFLREAERISEASGSAYRAATRMKVACRAAIKPAAKGKSEPAPR